MRDPLDETARLLIRKILSGIARAGERYGRRKIVAMLTGHIDDLPEPLTRLSTTGLLSGEPPATVERWIDSASGAGLIQVSSDEYRTLSLTSLGRDLLKPVSALGQWALDNQARIARARERFDGATARPDAA